MFTAVAMRNIVRKLRELNLSAGVELNSQVVPGIAYVDDWLLVARTTRGLEDLVEVASKEL